MVTKIGDEVIGTLIPDLWFDTVRNRSKKTRYWSEKKPKKIDTKNTVWKFWGKQVIFYDVQNIGKAKANHLDFICKSHTSRFLNVQKRPDIFWSCFVWFFGLKMEEILREIFIALRLQNF